MAAVVATVIRGDSNWLGKKMLLNELGVALGDDLSFALSTMKQALASGQSKRQSYSREVLPPHSLGPSAQIELFVEAYTPAPQLVCIGGGHITIALTQLAKIIGYRTIVIDPRAAFASTERFPHIDQLIAKWPNEALQHITLTRSTAIAVLTHDPKIDDTALVVALQSHAFYIGALGSKKTHAQRVDRLKQAGLNDEAIARMRAPIGLDIGAHTPEEIALAVMAEIIAAKNRR